MLLWKTLVKCSTIWCPKTIVPISPQFPWSISIVEMWSSRKLGLVKKKKIIFWGKCTQSVALLLSTFPPVPPHSGALLLVNPRDMTLSFSDPLVFSMSTCLNSVSSKSTNTNCFVLTGFMLHRQQSSRRPSRNLINLTKLPHWIIMQVFRLLSLCGEVCGHPHSSVDA